jgi:hypothetical protein
MATLAALFALSLAPAGEGAPALTVDRIVDGEWLVLETPDGRVLPPVPVHFAPTARDGERLTLRHGRH